jgi:protein SCO1
MLKVYTVLATILLVTGFALLTFITRRPRLPSDQAGIAYLERSDGVVVKADSVRPPERTMPPASKSPDSQPTNVAAKEEWLTSWTLTERSGKKISSHDLTGQPYVAGFFFSSCPSICPKQNEKVRQLQTQFKGKPVRFVSISCDPEVDRPEVLAEYAARFGADKDQWLFFTGDLNYIRRVGAEFFSLAIMRYAHPEKFALVDAQGKVYGFYTWSDANQWLALQTDIEKLMATGNAEGERGGSNGDKS